MSDIHVEEVLAVVTQQLSEVSLITTRQENQRIYIKVLYAGGQLEFTVNRSTPLLKLKKVFCNRLGLELKLMRFILRGNPGNQSQPIDDNDTVNSLNMQNFAVISAKIIQ